MEIEEPVLSDKLKDAIYNVPKSVFTMIVPPEDGSRIDILITNVHSDILLSGQVQPALPVRYAHKLRDHPVPKTLPELIEAMNPSADTKAPEPSSYIKKKPKLGEIYAMQYVDNRFYRVQVVEFSECDDVRVIYLDYGNKVWVDYKKLRELDRKNLFVPCQAVHFILADIEAPPEAIEDCFALTEYKTRCKFHLSKLIMNKVVKACVVRSTPTFIEVVIENELGMSVANNLKASCGSILKQLEISGHSGSRT